MRAIWGHYNRVASARSIFARLPLTIAANAANRQPKSLILLAGAPEGILTPDPQIRGFQGPVPPGSRWVRLSRRSGHDQAAADACSKPPIASRVMSSVSSSVNDSSVLMLNGCCANSSPFRTKMAHWPISQMATHKATRFWVPGGRNRRTIIHRSGQIGDCVRGHKLEEDLAGMCALQGEQLNVAAHLVAE